MSVIRHGEVIEVVYDAERIVVHAPACASHAHAVCDCEPAVFVAADQLQGAVDPRVLRDAVLTLKDAAIHDGVTDDVGAAIAALDVLTRGGQ
jgi:hypothetical protein